MGQTVAGPQYQVATVPLMGQRPPVVFDTEESALLWLDARPVPPQRVSSEYHKCLAWLPQSGRYWRPERVSSEHDVSGFSCGAPAVDSWLRGFAASGSSSPWHWVFVFPGDPSMGPVQAFAECSASYAAVPSGMDVSRYGMSAPQIPTLFVQRAGVTAGHDDPKESLTVLGLHVLSLAQHMAGLVPVMGMAASDPVVGKLLETMGGVGPVGPAGDWRFLRVLGAAEQARSSD